jgi:hypothetical protein
MTDILDVRIEASAFELRPLRHRLSTALREHSIDVHEGDDVVSLVNELATVAIIAGTGPLNVRVSLDHAAITAAVTELTERSGAREFVAARHAGSFRIVNGLADSWGYTCESEILRLWATSRIDPPQE